MNKKYLSLTNDYRNDEYPRGPHGRVREELDDEGGQAAEHGAPHPGGVTPRHLVGLVGGEAAEEAGHILDQRDDGQECGVHTDAVLKLVIVRESHSAIFMVIRCDEIKIFIFVYKQWV